MIIEGNWNSYLFAHGVTNDDAKNRSTFDTTAAALGLAAAGGRVAVVFKSYAESTSRLGHLISILGAAVDHPQAHYLIDSVKQLELRPEVVVVRSWIKLCFDGCQRGELGTAVGLE